MIKVVLIDDENDALESLSILLDDFIEGLEIIGTADGVASGIALIEEKEPDLVFLDINMKDGTGFDLLEHFEKMSFQVVFVTAYDQYAVKAFKYAATDYLLKPIDLQELRKTVDRIKSTISMKTDNYAYLKSIYNKPLPAKLALPNLEGFDLVSINQIIRCEGQNNYTTFYFESGKKIVVSKTLKEYENILEPHGFIRVFQSHIINAKKAEKYIKGRGGTVIMSDGTYIPVSREKKEILLKKLK